MAFSSARSQDPIYSTPYRVCAQSRRRIIPFPVITVLVGIPSLGSCACSARATTAQLRQSSRVRSPPVPAQGSMQHPLVDKRAAHPSAEPGLILSHIATSWIASRHLKHAMNTEASQLQYNNRHQVEHLYHIPLHDAVSPRRRGRIPHFGLQCSS